MRKLRLSTLRRVAFLLLLALFATIVLRWISLERWAATPEIAPTLSLIPTPGPRPPTPAKPPPISGKLETAKLFNGINLHAVVEALPGGSAAEERVNPENYVLDLKLLVRIPAPNKTIEELAKVNPELPRMLPGLATMLQPDSVSPFFAELYNTKVKLLRENLGRLDQLLSRHNFYDCQTVLQLRHPETNRHAILLQAEMDVDADGSDSDRLPIGSGISPNFKPFTSYRWPKKTAAPNPYLALTEDRIERYKSEAAMKTTPADRKHELRSAIAQLKDEVETLKKFSFMVGATDPYIVIPTGFAKGTGGKIGDCAVVIAGNGIYPAIVGDAGPPDKVGEASLRIAKEINALATPNNRPISDLKVTYLIFPGTAETPFGPPDLEKMYVRCGELVQEIGGATVPLHHWVNIIPPPATPTPTPSPSVSPSASESPNASPSPTFAFPTPTASASPTTNPSSSLVTPKG